MGTVSGNWITGAHSGRACNHENLYTKVNKKTGKCYSVKLCNPNTEWTEDQLSQRSSFGAISKAISAWIATNKVSTAENYADYLKVKATYDRQTKYATLRGMMYAKGMYTISADGTVTVDVNKTSGSSGSNVSGGGAASKFTLNLSASPAAGGTVTGAGSYAAGTSVNISAVANSGYSFTRWSDGNTNASRSVTMNADTSLQAVFTADGETPSGGEGGDESGEPSYN